MAKKLGFQYHIHSPLVSFSRIEDQCLDYNRHHVPVRKWFSDIDIVAAQRADAVDTDDILFVFEFDPNRVAQHFTDIIFDHQD